ncbi:MAG TPA: ABC transporter ATP-binding protein [Elusimicrobiota bacterium]|nr:ABC transporter ATP-binding protein [Elusimicrobiota bacterium]
MNPRDSAPGSQAILSVSNLRKQYPKTLAVDGISFEVGRHEILGLLGPNGAGKTTAINMVLGVLEPTSGSIRIQGRDLTTQRREALDCANFAAVYAPLPGNLTVWQNLRIFGLLYGVGKLNDRIDSLLAEFNLVKFKDEKCGVLSSGEQTRVSLAKAMLNCPRLLLLDEPTASLDPATANELRLSIRAFVDRGQCGILWTSHNMREVEQVCDRVLFLSHGKILLEGDPKTLPQDHGRNTLEELFIAIAREPLSLERD